jgi:hypothetical protein
VTDESHPHLSIGDEHRFVGFAGARSHRRVAHQMPELLRALAQGGVPNRVLQHGTPGFSALRRSTAGHSLIFGPLALSN